MLDDRVNAAPLFGTRKMKRELERGTHQRNAENTHESSGARERRCRHGKPQALLSEQIVARCRDVLEAELRHEVRSMTDRVNCTFEYQARYRPFYRNNGDRRVRRRRWIGSAHNTQNIGAFTVPTCGRGHPLLSTVDYPVVALSPGRRADALAGRRRGGIGAAARFAGAESSKWRAACPQKWCEQTLALVRRSAHRNR